MKEILIEKQIENILQYLNDPEFLNKQVEGIKQIKKSEAAQNLVLGIAGLAAGVFVISVFLLNYHEWLPIAAQPGEYGFALLVAGSVCVGPLMIVGGIFLIFSGFVAFVGASQRKSLAFADDIDNLCKIFYSTVLCQKPDLDQTQSKVKQILTVSRFILLPILQNYEKTGWDTYLEKPKPNSGTIRSMTCLLCGKKVEHVETALFPEEGTKVFGATVITDVNKDEETEDKKAFIKSAFLKCQHCGAVVCYECMGYEVPNIQRFLCPICGMATNGWTGLANRWLRLRNSMINEEYLFKELSLLSIRVDKTPRSDQRVVDIVIHLTGEHFGEVSFYNVAFSAKGKWFLASPEPILA